MNETPIEEPEEQHVKDGEELIQELDLLFKENLPEPNDKEAL